jgi:hypothetical protein
MTPAITAVYGSSPLERGRGQQQFLGIPWNLRLLQQAFEQGAVPGFFGAQNKAEKDFKK